jgi:hypothetical protein
MQPHMYAATYVRSHICMQPLAQHRALFCARLSTCCITIHCYAPNPTPVAPYVTCPAMTVTPWPFRHAEVQHSSRTDTAHIPDTSARVFITPCSRTHSSAYTTHAFCLARNKPGLHKSSTTTSLTTPHNRFIPTHQTLQHPSLTPFRLHREMPTHYCC